MGAPKTLLVALAASAAAATPTAVMAQSPDAPEAPTYQCRGANGYAADFDGRGTFLWRPQWIEAVAADREQRKERIKEADKALSRGPYSVTDKGKLVPGASANDYTSIGPYWWPDPAKKDGLPYTRRDGEVNPERSGPDFDKDRLTKLGQDMEALALGYYLTGDQRYADHAALLIRTWFLDPATRMAPNMDFAQGIPGRVKGRGEGIIESSDLSTVIESVGLIAPSGALSEEDMAGLKNWYAQFATWLATSENGTAEMQKTNNHGAFFDFYLAHFALFAGLESVTRDVADSFLKYRIGQQMDRQGRFIAELKRTKSWHYSNYVVAGSARLATIGECVGVDLWESELTDGRSMQTAKAFLDKYSASLSEWPFPDTDLSAQRFDRMERSHQVVAVLFGRGKSFPSTAELP